MACKNPKNAAMIVDKAKKDELKTLWADSAQTQEVLQNRIDSQREKIKVDKIEIAGLEGRVGYEKAEKMRILNLLVKHQLFAYLPKKEMSSPLHGYGEPMLGYGEPMKYKEFPDLVNKFHSDIIKKLRDGAKKKKAPSTKKKDAAKENSDVATPTDGANQNRVVRLSDFDDYFDCVEHEVCEMFAEDARAVMSMLGSIENGKDPEKIEKSYADAVEFVSKGLDPGYVQVLEECFMDYFSEDGLGFNPLKPRVVASELAVGRLGLY